MQKGWWGIPWFVFALAASAVAVVWYFVWPQDKADPGEGFRYLVVRWGHLAVWILVALNFWLRMAGKSLDKAADLAAVAGGVAYLVFLAFTYVFA